MGRVGRWRGCPADWAGWFVMDGFDLVKAEADAVMKMGAAEAAAEEVGGRAGWERRRG